MIIHKKIMLLFVSVILIFPTMAIAQDTLESVKEEFSDRPEIQTLLNHQLSDSSMQHTSTHFFTLTLKPGFKNNRAHRHQGDLFGYVIAGAIEIKMEGKDPVTYREGEIFHEKNLELHEHYFNASESDTTRVLMIHITPTTQD